MTDRGKCSAGFTVIELLTVLIILATLAGVSSLHVAPLLKQARLASGARQIASDLQLVRMKAIAQNRRFRVTFRPQLDGYVVERERDGRWVPHYLHGHGAERLKANVKVGLPTGVKITSVNSRGDIVFLPRGYVDGGMSLTLSGEGARSPRRVVVNLAGRVRIE